MSASRNPDANAGQPTNKLGEFGSHIGRDEPMTTKGVSQSFHILSPPHCPDPQLTLSPAQAWCPCRQRRRPGIPRQNSSSRLRSQRSHLRPQQHPRSPRPSQQRPHRSLTWQRIHKDQRLRHPRRRHLGRCAHRHGPSGPRADEQ